MIIKFITLCFIFISTVRASEVDQFTNHFHPLNDATDVINTKINEYVAKSIESHNSKSSVCDEELLYKEMRVYLNHQHSSKLVHFADHDSSIDRRNFKLSDSIYGDWYGLDGLALANNKARKNPETLASVIRLGNVEIGTDKFMHLFGIGFILYKRHYIKGQSLQKVLKAGFSAERTYLGGWKIADGVYSFADLVANFQGIRFWNNVLGKNADLLGKKLGPYITCKDNKFIQTAKVEIMDYLDEGFDETVNCSHFATQRGANKVIARLEGLQKKDPAHSYSCPIDASKLPELVKKYESISNDLINLKGHKKID